MSQPIFVNSVVVRKTLGVIGLIGLGLMVSTNSIRAKKPAAFAWGDSTWLNGQTRQTQRPMQYEYLTLQSDIDINYTYSLAAPIDDTVVGSTALARNNEFQLSFITLGADFHYSAIRARVLLQYGTRVSTVSRNDGSVLRGQFDLIASYRYLTEAYTGYHWDRFYGINLDVGIFMSYIGLLSYCNFENWVYQPSYTSDNTPWFFNGVRLQMFLTDRLKMELWLINGWQSYAKYNRLPGVGYQITYRPQSYLAMVFNGYLGTDTQDHPDRIRMHSDNSIMLRYWEQPHGVVSRGALSFTLDVGGEQGGGVTLLGGIGGPAQQFVSSMVYHRLWFWEHRLGWTFGGGFIQNPGRYLVLTPVGVSASLFPIAPGTQFFGWDCSTTFDWMPTSFNTWRLEWVHRQVDVPYYNGHFGVTSPDGYQNTPIPSGWQPNLVKQETRVILAFISRF